MKFEREAHGQYEKACALAKKNLQDKKKQKLPVCPAALNTIQDEKMISYRIDLGILDIPTNLILGAAGHSDKSMLYTRGFLPLSTPESEYAAQWISLYREQQNGKGFEKAITCYEYLGKFYVRDGMKRVSVSKYAKTLSIKAHVVRILPMCLEEQEAVWYFDFLRQYHFTQLYQLQFTQQGFFEKLQRGLGCNPSHRWTDRDRERFLQYWPSIEYAFLKSYEDALSITAADALVVIMNRYSFDQITSMDSWVLARVFQSFGKELYQLSFPAESSVKVNAAAGALQTA